ncbi:unnamed protein product [Gongylonema pulchrum]|uniref:4HBT domain-containing protein n=1 Tax=Gongylonema pulchrum TaxID=637853 RepID=A0A183DU23_9BILA|nr:unnamed protein product [Gongylonema pulchrum]
MFRNGTPVPCFCTGLNKCILTQSENNLGFVMALNAAVTVITRNYPGPVDGELLFVTVAAFGRKFTVEATAEGVVHFDGVATVEQSYM